MLRRRPGARCHPALHAAVSRQRVDFGQIGLKRFLDKRE